MPPKNPQGYDELHGDKTPITYRCQLRHRGRPHHQTPQCQCRPAKKSIHTSNDEVISKIKVCFQFFSAYAFIHLSFQLPARALRDAEAGVFAAQASGYLLPSSSFDLITTYFGCIRWKRSTNAGVKPSHVKTSRIRAVSCMSYHSVFRSSFLIPMLTTHSCRRLDRLGYQCSSRGNDRLTWCISPR